MYFKIPDPPKSLFEIDTDERGEPRLSWALRRSWFSWLVVAFLSCWLVAWAVGEVVMIGKLLNPPNPGAPPPRNQFNERWFYIEWLVGWTLGGLAAMGQVVGTLRPKKERLTFGESVLRCEPGTSFFGMLVDLDRHGNPRLFRRKRRIEVDRSTIRRVCIDEVTYQSENILKTRQRLRLVCEDDEIELGALLDEPSREWFGGVIAIYAGVPLERE